MSQSDAASAAKPDWTTRITLMLTVIFGVGGLAVEMYSTEMRNGVQSSLSPIGRFGVPIALGVLTAILVYRLRRRGKTKPDIRIQAETEPAPIAEPECVKIEHKRITIDADTQQRVPDADQVLGRDIHILESKYESKDLYIFLPGLGLDAKDFEPYMRAARFHCVALTLFGFNEEEHDNRDYWSITHQGHLQVIAFVLRQIHRACVPEEAHRLVRVLDRRGPAAAHGRDLPRCAGRDQGKAGAAARREHQPLHHAPFGPTGEDRPGRRGEPAEHDHQQHLEP
jgi:hypothetical protein